MSEINPSEFFGRFRKSISEEERQQEINEFAASAIYDQLFPKQQLVLDDPYRWKALLTPRRCGKTYCALSYGLIQALTKPYSNIVILALTLKSAKKLYWDEIQRFDREYNLNLHLVHTEAIARFPNGSRIDLVGAQTRAEIEKLRGGSYDLVVIDEAASFSAPVLHELISDILDPALMDRQGTLLLTGTPGAVLAGPFYEATYPAYKDERGNYLSKPFPMPETLEEATGDPGAYWWLQKDRLIPPLWHRHTFNQKDNTACPHLWDEALRRKQAKRWTDENPTWLREYKGQWISMGDSMVYAFSRVLDNDGQDDCRALYRREFGPNFNKWGLPAKEEWRYVLGIDMGFEDATGIVVVAYSPTHDTFYLVYEFKETHMTPSQIGSKLESIQRDFANQIEIMVADTANMGKAIVEEINNRFDVVLVPAEKKNKNDYIELLNADIIDGKIKIWPGSELGHEWKNLQWDLRTNTKKVLVRYGKLTENRNQDNHLADAILYTWRYCNHHFHRMPVETPDEGTPDWFDRWDKREAKKAAAERDAIDSGLTEWSDDLQDYDYSWIL